MKCYEAVTGRGLLDPKLSGQFSSGYGTPATENETQGLSVVSRKSTSRLRLFEVGRRRADKNREVLGSGDVADDTSRGPIFAAYDKSKISVTSRAVVFTNRDDDIPEDAGGGPQRAQMQDSDHRSMLAIRRHKALNQLLCMRVIPHGGSSACRPKFHIKAYRVHGGFPLAKIALAGCQSPC